MPGPCGAQRLRSPACILGPIRLTGQRARAALLLYCSRPASLLCPRGQIQWVKTQICTATTRPHPRLTHFRFFDSLQFAHFLVPRIHSHPLPLGAKMFSLSSPWHHIEYASFVMMLLNYTCIWIFFQAIIWLVFAILTIALMCVLMPQVVTTFLGMYHEPFWSTQQYTVLIESTLWML